jgi:hypothetical protein
MVIYLNRKSRYFSLKLLWGYTIVGRLFKTSLILKYFKTTVINKNYCFNNVKSENKLSVGHADILSLGPLLPACLLNIERILKQKNKIYVFSYTEVKFDQLP